MLKFTKMNGAGNDFVVVDNRDNSLFLSEDQIKRLCDRQRGVGADGFLAVEPSQNGADYRMRYYNADGGEAEMCGNGARCFARFVNQLEGNSLTETNFETIAGVIKGEFLNDEVRIQLSKPFDFALNETLEIKDRKRLVHSVNTGVPHAVIFVDELASVDVCALGAATRHHDHFAPTGTNVNFVQIIEPGSICIRTFERGVEAETLACGTGMVACSIVHHEISDVPSPIRVTVAGGDTLEVGFDRVSEGAYENVTLLGPAEFTFEGILETI
ncbi:MAG: diaminopimelate epimerase [Verrucomicrobiales bacterium]|nr:diaminopimelate epimerase [Verrucomicrobiales bacterium]|tara:strand:- start:26241 stop:27053 length:813 start_codon:yes stop_codon:yes gene_type:complete